MADNEYIGMNQMAKEWGSTGRTIQRYIKEGKLPAKTQTVGKCIRYKVLKTDWETFKARYLKDVA